MPSPTGAASFPVVTLFGSVASVQAAKAKPVFCREGPSFFQRLFQKFWTIAQVMILAAKTAGPPILNASLGVASFRSLVYACREGTAPGGSFPFASVILAV